MSLSKNIHCYRKCCAPSVQLISQYNTHGSNTIDPQKMQAKSVVLSQWKLISQLKNYFSKFSNDKTFENALNKEFAQFLQKIQPSVYGNNLVRYFESTSTIEPTEIKADKEKTTKTTTSLANVLSGLGIKLGNGEKKEVVSIPKWKLQKRAISKETIVSRTNEILASLVTVDNDDMRLSRIDELCLHLRQYPEAKHNAVKGGAVRFLLRIRKHTKSMEILGAISEALALLGFTDPVPGNGVRILSIDGGGVRGILVVEMLKKLEEFSGKPIHEMFDLICGVSTGAIIANLIAVKQKSLDEIRDIYKNISTEIFTQSPLKGTSNLVLSHSYYDTQKWEALLKKDMGEEYLIKTRRNLKCPKLCAVSTVVNQSRLSAYLFRNYALPCRVQSQYMGSSNHQVWEAVRASAAAPTYFEEFKLGNMLHQDGGILINNPTAVAIHEAKLLWPTTPLQCVVSFGTGRTAPNPIDPTAEPVPVTSSTWKHKFFAIIESATDTEGVHTMLNDLLPENVYYRFNPYLTEMLDIAEINPEKLEQLERDAVMYLRRNEDKFKEAAETLNVKKSMTQKILDWFYLEREIQGFNIK